MLKKTINILLGKNIGMEKIKSKYDKILSYKSKDGSSKKLEYTKKINKKVKDLRQLLGYIKND